jgi:hypothetical protein
MNERDDRSMNCDEVRGELPGLLYGELDAETRAAVERHLDSCPACRAEREAHQQTASLLDRWPEPEPPMMPPILATPPPAIVGGPGPSRVYRLLAPLAIGAAAAAVLFGVFVLFCADARYSDGQLTVTFGRGSPAEDRPATPVWDDETALQVRDLARAECDSRIEWLLGLLGEELHELNVRHERNQVMLARAVDQQRERDRRMQTAALESLARGLTLHSDRQGQAIARMYDMMEAGGVVPASYIEPQGKE